MKHKFILLIVFALFYFSCDSPKEKPSSAISLKEMIGQMIMVGFSGMEIDSVSHQFLNQLDSGYIGGIVLFDYDVRTKSYHRNIGSPRQVKSLIADLQKKSKTPLFVAVDQEGGLVNRLKPKYGFPKIVSAKYLGEINDIDSTKYYALLNAANIKNLGFNVNFSPVVDIDLNPDNPVIGKYERSYSDQSDIVIKHAKAWIEVHDSLGILSTLKHFPGHGSSDADSHEGITDITNLWKTQELIPFRKLSALDYSIAIMTAHVVNNNLDSIYPATLSKEVIDKILRKDWGFEGIVFSDDLQMKAVNELFDIEVILKHSIDAGVDVLVFGNNLEYDEMIPERAVQVITKLVESGVIKYERIAESYRRIMSAKKELGK